MASLPAIRRPCCAGARGTPAAPRGTRHAGTGSAPRRLSITAYGRVGTATSNEEAEAEDLGAQMKAAADAIRAAALRLLREGEVHPQLVVLAAARVAGELGAGGRDGRGGDARRAGRGRAPGRSGA